MNKGIKRALLLLATLALVCAGTVFSFQAVSAQSDNDESVSVTDGDIDGDTNGDTAKDREKTERDYHGKPNALPEVLGLEPSEFIERLKAGETLPQILESQGVSVEEAVNALIDRIEERIAQHVATGKLTQERADSILESKREKLTNFLSSDTAFTEKDDELNGEGSERGRRGQGRFGKKGGGTGNHDETMSATNTGVGL